jgi:hypothetical protein
MGTVSEKEKEEKLPHLVDLKVVFEVAAYRILGPMCMMCMVTR